MRLPVVLTIASLFCACAGPSAQTKKSLAQYIAERDCAGAERLLLKAKDPEYGPANSVLHDLDLGMVLHECGRYSDSNERFARAEDRMDELYTKSLSKETAAFLASETVTDYAGEAFERALVHVFHAVNYAILGQRDEALVEVRRLEELRQDDAFGHYLSALLYEDAGKADDARISYEAAQKAYARYSQLYGMAAPRIEFPTDLGTDGELVLLHYNGPAPRKISVSAFDAPPDAAEVKTKGPGTPAASTSFLAKAGETLKAAGVAAKDAVLDATGKVTDASGRVLGVIVGVHYPRYVQDEFLAVRSQVQAATRPETVDTVLVEDISAIAIKALAERVALIKTRSAARGALKLVAQAASGVDASGAQTADVRGWGTLPAQIRMARVKLPPGRSDVTVRFLDGAGNVVAAQDFKDVVIKAGRRTWLTCRTLL